MTTVNNVRTFAAGDRVKVLSSPYDSVVAGDVVDVTGVLTSEFDGADILCYVRRDESVEYATWPFYPSELELIEED